MRYELRIMAYDVLDSVHVSLTLYDTTLEDRPFGTPVVHTVATHRGTGEADPLRWTRDALVQVLETL